MENSTENQSYTKFEIEREKLKFEKLKFNYNLLKWFLGSIVLVIITTLINHGLKDRAAGLQELEQYDKYVTELIILNKDPGQKRMLAQFFAYVTPSDKLKKGWEDYYNEIDKEYKRLYSTLLNKDSIIRNSYFALKNQIDTLNSQQRSKLIQLKQKIKANDSIINPSINIPNHLLHKDYELAIMWEKEGFHYLLEKNVEKAIFSFQSSENAYNQFHNAYEIVNYLKNNKQKLIDKNSDYWNIIIKKIITDYSWKMPREIKKLLSEIK